MSGINNYFSNNNIFNGTEIPTQGKFDVGDIIVNIGENAEEEPMWMCIEAGEPGVWKVVGKVEDIDLSGYQEKTDENLATESKDLVGAINELFQSANNGKELIANAIGEPLNAEDTFSAMNNDINSLLSIFKTNMMNSGVTVESGDKFKQLIDKIKGLTEGEGNKGVQYASGTIAPSELKLDKSFINYYSGSKYEQVMYYLTINSLSFTPSIIIITGSHNHSVSGIQNTYGIFDILNNIPYHAMCVSADITDAKNLSGSFTGFRGYPDVNVSNSIDFPLGFGSSSYITPNSFTWHAFGVGEEDTTLRDSLASILQEEGVSVTPEDEMANLITKTDEEFNNKNNTISGLEGDIENTRSTLAGLMKDGGYEITGSEDIDTLLGLLTASGIKLYEIKQIACGDSHTFILKTDGSIWACGLNSDGQLGLGHNANSSLFTQVTTNINNDVKQIACDNNYTVILKTDGSIWACGYNYYGHLGLGDTEDRNTFTKVTTNINNDVKQIACGENHNFILKNDGSVWACGYNYYGQLGLGTSGYGANTTFTKVTTNINNDVKQIACGDNHTFILKNDGSIWSCGRNDKGQLGLGVSDNNDHTTFTKVTTNINNDVKQIACGDNHTFILKNDGTVYSCGNNTYGGLGLNDTLEKDVFTKVTTNINNVKEIVCEYERTFILKNDGSVWACGYNNFGQLGLGENNVAYNTFTKVTTNINNDVKQVACGVYHTFILKNDGSVWSCGYNNLGQLGVGDYTEREIFFTQIPKGLY